MKLKLKIHTIECENKLLLIVVESVVELGLSFFSFKLEVTADAPCVMGVCAFRTGTSCCLLCELSCEPARGLGRVSGSMGVMGEGSGEVIREKMGSLVVVVGGSWTTGLSLIQRNEAASFSRLFFACSLVQWCTAVSSCNRFLWKDLFGVNCCLCRSCLAQTVPVFV